MGTPGVQNAVAFVGFDGATFSNAPNTGVIFVPLKPFAERADIPKEKILAELRGKMFSLREAFVFVLEPPSVPGIGTGGGLKGYVQDRAARGLPALEGATWALAGAAGQTPGLTQAFTLFSTRTPQIWAEIDRTKAEQLGVPIGRVFETLSVYMGSAYVNDFNILGRTYRVTAQADNPYRLTLRDVANLKTRSVSGEMVPIGSVATFTRHHRSLSRGALQSLSRRPRSRWRWCAASPRARASPPWKGWRARCCPRASASNGRRSRCRRSSPATPPSWPLAWPCVFVFLLLAALYESWLLPLAVILIVPMCILAAMIGVNIRGLDRNILVEIGLVVLVGLAAKNAILIVEFAKQAHEAGMSRYDAAVTAARTRLRPILMTSLAFILGVVPLVFSTGAGAEMRQSLGTAVFSGMLGVTLFGLIFTPVFYVISTGLSELRFKWRKKDIEVALDDT